MDSLFLFKCVYLTFAAINVLGTIALIGHNRSAYTKGSAISTAIISAGMSVWVYSL